MGAMAQRTRYGGRTAAACLKLCRLLDRGAVGAAPGGLRRGRRGRGTACRIPAGQPGPRGRGRRGGPVPAARGGVPSGPATAERGNLLEDVRGRIPVQGWPEFSESREQLNSSGPVGPAAADAGRPDGGPAGDDLRYDDDDAAHAAWLSGIRASGEADDDDDEYSDTADDLRATPHGVRPAQAAAPDSADRSSHNGASGRHDNGDGGAEPGEPPAPGPADTGVIGWPSSAGLKHAPRPPASQPGGDAPPAAATRPTASPSPGRSRAGRTAPRPAGCSPAGRTTPPQVARGGPATPRWTGRRMGPPRPRPMSRRIWAAGPASPTRWRPNWPAGPPANCLARHRPGWPPGPAWAAQWPAAGSAHGVAAAPPPSGCAEPDIRDSRCPGQTPGSGSLLSDGPAGILERSLSQS